MPADISTAIKNWSTTESSNSPSGGALVGGNLDDNLRALQVGVRALAASASVASAATVDLNAQDAATFLTVTGTTTITALGTVSAGIYKWLVFAGALTLTHNATSLILPTAANITTAAGDAALMLSLGSGNWRCLSYMRADGKPVNTAITVADGTVSAPGVAFASDTNTGIYRIGADNVGIALGGVKVADLASTTMVIGTSSHTEIEITASAASSFIRNVVGTTGAMTVEVDGNDTDVFAILGKTVCRLSPGRNSSQVGTDINILAGAGGSGTSTYLGGEVNIDAGDGYNSGGVRIHTPINNRGGVVTGYGLISVYAEGVSDDVGMQVNPAGQVVSHFGPAPTIASGAGTGASIAGTNNGFRITCGTSAGTSIVVNLSTTVPAAPYAVANYRNGTTSCRVSATSTTQITLALGSAPSNGDVIDVLVFYPHRETHLA